MNYLTAKELLEAQQQIFLHLQEKEKELESIQHSRSTLIVRWQKLLEILLGAQCSVIQKFGFAGNQNGLSQFNDQWVIAAATNPSLREANEKKWLYIFEKAFGLKGKLRSISLPEARDLMKDIFEAMTSPEFLLHVDAFSQSLDPQSSLIEKRQKLLEILVPLHMSVMEKHGYSGEEGYIQAQRALMDFFHDPLIVEHATRAQFIVFKKAKLLV